ncbi:MAG: sugar MFS transporter [Bacteroidetes bacterium]|uniref:Sugar MFS transporter n=1 Tax=Candidatus Cryptobacteroides faecipullorum TaxID=2840764 RepID=A0A9D9I7C9_9BACT|nr:sugar MFS transporter [Candidatus Cryptobacteroides faecipullorum]
MKALEKKYLLPFALVTSLFLLLGLANNMTDTLLAAFKRIMDMSDAQTSLIQFAFYGSYFCFALPAAIFISRHSFKSGIILGLLLYAAGAILFLPAAYAASYGFYLVAIYIMAGGCSVLETTANPYILSMGSPETATRRLNIAQSFNPIGSIIGILMSKYFILKDISLYSVSGTYASLGLVLIAILVAILFVKMPAGRDSGNRSGILASFGRLFRNRLYRYGVVAQFFYVGAQIGVWSFTIRIVMQELGVLEAQASTIYLITIIGFCLSRFIYTWLMKWVSPAKLLLAGGVLSTLMTAVVVLGAGSGWLLIVALVLISFFMSLMFPTIYGLSLGGVAQSEHPDDAKLGASGLIMAILGGALLTPLQGLVSDNSSIYMSYIIPAICFVVVTLFAAYAVKTNRRIYA